LLCQRKRLKGKQMTLKVNGQTIRNTDIQQEFDRLKPHYDQVFKDQPPDRQKEQLYDWSRENVIEKVLINQEAEKRFPHIPNEEIDSALEQQIKVRRLLQQLYSELPEPLEDDLQQFYQHNKSWFTSPERIRVSHIVRHINWQTDDAQAYNIIKQAQRELTNGALFETVVAKYSDCPENNGDLGLISRGKMVEEFDDVVFHLAVNELSDIFKTRFGYHIAKLYTRIPAATEPLDHVRQQVAEQVKNQMQIEAVENFLDQLKEKATIEES